MTVEQALKLRTWSNDVSTSKILQNTTVLTGVFRVISQLPS